ncbi:MAG: hypothetical protein ACRD2A_00250 [Vicinamibacterales bacterium]
MARLDLTPAIAACHRHVRWPLGLALLSLVAMHVAGGFDTVRDFFEGGNSMVVERGGWARPEWLTGLPYTLTPYAPGYFTAVALLNSAVAAVTNVEAWPTPVVSGRLLSVAAGLVTSAMAAVAVARRIGAVEPGLVAAAVFLSYSGVSFWINLFRVDALATAFAIATYAAASGSAGLVVSGLLVVAGSLVKQTTILAAAPVALHLAFTGRLGSAARYLAGVGLAAAAIWAVVFVASGGYYFDISIVGNRRDYSVTQAIAMTADFTRKRWTLLAGVALVCAWLIQSSPLRRCQYVVALLVASVIAAAFSGIEGASTNFFLEPSALAAIVIGMYGVGPLWRASPQRTALVLWATSAVLIVWAGSAAAGSIRRDRPPLDLSAFRAELPHTSVFVDWRFLAAARQAGLRPMLNDPFFLTIVVRNGAFKLDPMLEDLRSGRIAGLVLFTSLFEQDDVPGWPPELVTAFRSHFETVGELDGAYLYRFRQP